MEVPTGFVEAELNGFYIMTRPVYYDLALDLARRDPEQALAAPEKAGPAGPMQGRGVRVELATETGEILILKKQRRGGLYGRLMGDIHRSDYRAISEVVLSETAWKKGVPVALLAFAMSAPAGPGRLASYRRGYVASIKVPGARNMMEWLADPDCRPERRAVLAAAAHTINRAHDRGFQHGDMNLGNILVVRSNQGEYSAWLIDLSHSTLGGTLRFKPRVDNLVRLYRSAEKWLPATDAAARRGRFRDVVRFLRAYTGGEKGAVRRVLEAGSRHRTSLFLHRLGWKASRAGSRGGARSYAG
ncbi:MAG TPA: lipopolysaccharide kinase InaA family protein [Candidatus Polarisedimenticolia bacterium]|nr:lipopolysaccharide kinase InaA family protein [Candidatus Polarisedimenticolia bacterium]